MVSQLILFVNAISDSSETIYSYQNSKHDKVVLNSSTTIEYLYGDSLPYKKVTATALQILGGNEYVKNLGDPTPLTGGYPQEVKEPVKPTDPKDMPVVTRPTYVQKPTAPAVVECPIAPEVVTDPRTESMDEPIKDPILDDPQYKAVISALDSGVIAKRAEITEDYVFVPTKTLEKAVMSSENVSVTFYGSDDTTVLSRIITSRYSSVEYEGATPTKDSTDTHAFYFIGWVDAYGNEPDLSNVEGNMELYPIFRSVNLIKIDFYDTDRKTVIYTVTIEEGDSAKFVGTLPTKVDEIAKYTFDCWVDESGNKYNLSSPTASAKLYPSFTSIPYLYIVYYAEDGVTPLYTNKILLGESTSYVGETPVKSPDHEADYIFNGWVDKDGNSFDFTAPKASVNLYPAFDTVRYVYLTFYDANGNLIESETKRVLPGTSVVFGGTTPTKATEYDELYESDYIFIGWKDEAGNLYDLTSADASAKLSPAFEEIRYAVINFHGTDGMIICTERVKLGEKIVFSGTLPSKDPEPEAGYLFSHWEDVDGNTVNLEAAERSVDLYPEFTVTDFIMLYFYDANGNLIESETKRVLPGTSVVFGGTTPAKATEYNELYESDYIFIGWKDEAGNLYDLTSADASAKLSPAFEEIRYAVINFHGTDGTVVCTERVKLGDSVSYVGETPVKATDDAGAYTFAHWVDGSGSEYDLAATVASADLYPYFDLTPYVTVTFYAADGLTVLYTEKVLRGDGVTYAGEIPTKPVEPEAEYSFKYWVDADGNEYDLLTTHGDISLYPAFDVTEYAIVTFYGTDGTTVIDRVRIPVGSSAGFSGDTPVKAADSDAVYTFDYWVDSIGNRYDLTAVPGSVDLYPHFDPTYYIIITFYGADGITVLSTVKVLPGESVAYDGETPTKASEPEADYSFDNAWLNASGEVFDLSAPTSSASLYPKFKTTRYIIVNFFAADGTTVLETVRVRPGGRIIYSGDTPVKAGDDVAVYAFSHWAYANGEEYNFEFLGSSTDFYPVFNATPYVTVTFYASDRATVIDVQKVLKGGTVAFGAELPTKAGTSDFEYEFSCWTYEDGSVCDFAAFESSVALYPSFDEIPYVTLVFNGLDGSYLHSVKVLVGTKAEFVGDIPTKPSDIVADYVFSGWADENGTSYDISNVTASAYLYPAFDTVYKEYELDTNVDGTGIAQFKVDLSAEDIYGDIPAEHFISVAASNRAALMIVTEKASVRMPYSMVSAMKSANVSTINVNVEVFEDGYECAVILKNAEGAIINDALSLTVSILCEDEEFAAAASVSYVDSAEVRRYVTEKYENHRITFSAVSGVVYSVFIHYDINISADLPIGINVSTDRAQPGDIVVVTLTEEVPLGKILEIYYLDSDAQKHVISNTYFIMPDEYVTIGASLTDIVYTVTFISDGKVLAENQYKYGDTVVVPRDPAKQNDETYSYTFSGWSEEVEMIVTGDAIYYAEFSASLIPEDTGSGHQILDKYMGIIRLSAVLAVLLVASLVVLLFTRKPRGFIPE